MSNSHFTMAQDQINAKLPDPPPNFCVESALSTELLKLSFKTRLEIEDELHGVGCRAVKESPVLVELALTEFDCQVNDRKEIDPSISVLRRVVRNSPITRSNCYVNDPNIRLRFLRCERFIVEKAVQRFIDFLEFMTELFGDFVAERPVRISDFNQKEEEALMKSRNQYLPFRDRSGRRVLVGVGNCNFHMEPILRYKIFMYLHWAVSEDVETQIKGVVILCWAFDENNDSTWESNIRPNMSADLRSYHKQHRNSIPVRVASWQHYFRDTPYYRLLARLYVYNVDDRYRPIYKVHFGSQLELNYKLSGYGVPIELIPISSTGKLKFNYHRAMMNTLRTKMKMDVNSDDYKEIVECPRFNDVVFRKGPAAKLNTGNATYRELLRNYSFEHFTGDKQQKYDITMLIIQKIESRNGRFLDFQNMWVVITDGEQVRQKVAAAIKQYNRGRRKIELVGGKTRKVEKELDTSDEEKTRSKRFKTTQNKVDGDNACFGGKCFFPVPGSKTGNCCNENSKSGSDKFLKLNENSESGSDKFLKL